MSSPRSSARTSRTGRSTARQSPTKLTVWETLLHGLLEPAFLAGPDGRLLQENTAARDWRHSVGLLPTEAPATPTSGIDLPLRHPDGTPLAPDHDPVLTALRTGAAIRDLPLCIHVPGGDPLFTLWSAAPLRESEAPVAGVLASFRPLPGGADAYRQWLNLLHPESTPVPFPTDAPLDSLEEGLILYGPDLRVILANRAYSRLLGIREPVVGRTLQEVSDLVKENLADPSQFMEAVQQAIDGTEPQERRMEIEVLRPERRTLERTTRPVLDQQGGLVGRLAVYRDITEQRALDRQRDNFISSASHELRTPLAVILGYAQLLQKHWTDRDAVLLDGDRLSRSREQVGAIVAEAKSMAQFLEGLLDLPRLQAGGLEIPLRRLDIGELVARALPHLQERAEGHPLEYSQPKRPIMVMGNDLRLEQVLAHLVTNAARYSNRGTPITLRVERPRGKKAAHVSVQDKGVGLAPEEIQRVFDRFYRVPGADRQVPSGLGLGLYLSAEIVRLHHGRLWAESEGPGHGSTFIIELPLAD